MTLHTEAIDADELIIPTGPDNRLRVTEHENGQGRRLVSVAPHDPPVEPSMIDPWDFNGPHDLHAALEEYTSFLDGTVLRCYGLRTGENEIPTDVLKNVQRRRLEIDRCMEILECTRPFYWRLLDTYYRRGASTEARLWLLTAIRMGLRKAKCPPLVRCVITDRGHEDGRHDLKDCDAAGENCCHWDHDEFRNQIKQAIDRLFYVHRLRRGDAA